MAELAARTLSDARLHLVDGRGHLLAFADWGVVMASMVGWNEAIPHDGEIVSALMHQLPP